MTRSAAIAVLALLGCTASMRMKGASPPSGDLRRRGPAPLRAGTARADVTPPPGPSTFGHGPDARVAEGYWSRLYCRVFVLETDPADRLAIAACDLHSVSALLHREVAERVRDVVPASRLMITATHTHAGPAHYFESAAYSGFASSRRPGFDPRMVDFLASRIAEAIRAARADLRPAAARWVRADAWGLTRNRSLQAYRANPSPAGPAPPADLQLGEEEKAIDPALHVLQIEAVDPADGARLLGPIGWMVFFAMHPTVLGARNRLFGGDVFGVTSRLLEAELRRSRQERCAPSGAGCAEGADPLAALVNTNEGDVSPVWSSGTEEEAVRVGRSLAERAWATRAGHADRVQETASAFRRSIVIDSRYLEAKLPGAPYGEGSLCEDGELGQAAGHGASDHPTSFDALSAPAQDVDGKRDDCQKPKKRMMGIGQTLILGRAAFPSHAALALLRLDDTWLAFVPAEMTVQAGASLTRRLRGAVRTEDGRPAQVLIAGLANGYLQYVTTRREYEMQKYEGASTLYGPGSAEFLEDRFLLLARSMRGEAVEWRTGDAAVGEAPALEVRAPPERPRFPRPDDGTPLADLLGIRRQRGLCTIPGPAPAAVCFWWADGAPGRVPMGAGRWMALVGAKTSAPVKTCAAQPPLGHPARPACDPGAVIDDRGLDFQTRIRGHAGDGWVWSSLLRLSDAEWVSLAGSAGVRLQAGGSAGVPPVESEAFTPEKMPALCPDEAVRFCLGDAEPEPR